jgi:subtilisin family serine protease
VPGLRFLFYNDDSDASDDHGHGTFVAGIIAASENSMGVKGLYHQARIIPVKVLGEAGQGTYEDTAAGIIWAVDHHAKIINLSIGSYAFSNLLRDAVNYALEKDVWLLQLPEMRAFQKKCIRRLILMLLLFQLWARMVKGTDGGRL